MRIAAFVETDDPLKFVLVVEEIVEVVEMQTGKTCEGDLPDGVGIRIEVTTARFKRTILGRYRERTYTHPPIIHGTGGA